MDTSHLVEIQDLKLRLVNFVCATLIHQPRYYSPDPERRKLELLSQLQTMAGHDPEFIFKTALYVRQYLNIRSTANFIVAAAADLVPCRPFFKKYFSSCIHLPTDLLDVVSLFLTLPARANSPALPSVLRRAVQRKFLDFDAYQVCYLFFFLFFSSNLTIFFY